MLSWQHPFGVGALILWVITIPSSEQMEATPKQIKEAQDAADRAELIVVNKNKENVTINIDIDTKDAINAVDSIAKDYFYERLYERTVKKAKEENIPIKNLMSVSHIRWEYCLHEMAFYLGFDAAKKTNLNVEETPFSMIKRALLG